jgi:futalosine hydrolase
MRLLVVTAVAAERDALAGSGLTVIAGGVGPARAAASTATALAQGAYDGVLSAGIAGGFADRVAPGGTVIGTASIAADLGAETPDGFLTLDELGFGSSTVECDAQLVGLLRKALPDAVVGPVLSVSTVTGSAARSATLRGRYPDAVAEGMEGFGVAVAAAAAGVPFAELRTISNPIGPRDRAAWRIPEALAALAAAASALAVAG